MGEIDRMKGSGLGLGLAVSRVGMSGPRGKAQKGSCSTA